MKLSANVKPGEETKVAWSAIHAKGRYIFQVQEGIEMRVTDKGAGNAYTYYIPMKSVDTAGEGADPASVGLSFHEWINVMFHDSEINKSGFELISAILIHAGVASPDDDVDLTNPQYADKLKLKLVDKMIGIEIGHRKEKVTKKKDDDGNLVDLPEEKQVDRPFALKVFPVGGGSAKPAATAQPKKFDY